MSAPATNAPPSPRRTTARTSGSASRASTAPGSCSHISTEMALRRSGWSKTIQPTAPSFSCRTRPPTRVSYLQGGAMSQVQDGDGPLAGTFVLDVTHVMAGSYCGLLLSLMGADVVKVERAGGGDDLRRNQALSGGAFRPHDAVNHGKRSLAIDLRDPRGADVLRRLADSGRRLRRELPAGHARAPGRRLRCAARAQPAAGDVLDQRVRGERPRGEPARLRPRGAGHGRHHEPDRRAWPSAGGGGRSARGPERRLVRGDGHSLGAARARTHRARAARRHLALRSGAGLHGVGVGHLVRHGAGAAAGRLLASARLALRGIPHGRRPL